MTLCPVCALLLIFHQKRAFLPILVYLLTDCMIFYIIMKLETEFYYEKRKDLLL